MKKVVIFLLLTMFSIASFGQSNERVLEEALDTKFISWASEWSVDSYVTNSVRVKNIDYSNKQKWFVTETFTRFLLSYTIGFVSTVVVTSDNFEIRKICYDDSSSGTKDCKHY